MKYLFIISKLILILFLLILYYLSIFSGHYLASIFILAAALMSTTPVKRILNKIAGMTLPSWWRWTTTFVLCILFLFIIIKDIGNKLSIYKDAEIESRLMSIYDEKLKHWPTPFETRYINTQYGKVHIIISGPKGSPPVFLLHASSMAGWSWLYNVAGLNEKYCTYAIDAIGDAGRSALSEIDKYPMNGNELALLYSEIMDKLGVKKAAFIGASQGGYIATNMALYAPARVNKIVLCGPMGFAGINESMIRKVFTTMFPSIYIIKSAIRETFGNDPVLSKEIGEWYSYILKGVIPRQAYPKPFTDIQLSTIKTPVLMLLGQRDGFISNSERTKEIVKNIKNVQVETLDTSHLMSAEMPDKFNKLVIDFIDK